MPRLDLERDLRDLSAPLRLEIPCANPFCNFLVVYVGQFCASCRSVQAGERERLQLKKEAARD